MTLYRFIKLHDRNGCADVLVNANHIVAIRDLRSDKLLKGLRKWQWTIVDTLSKTYEVTETEEEITKLISKLQ